MKKKEYESLVNELKGNRLLKVLYYEAEYNNTEIYWNRNSEFDSLDFGLDLITDSGRCFGIIWGSEFFQYGVSIKNHSLKKELSSYRSFNVTSEIKWSLLLNSKIIKTKVIWSWVINTEKQNKIYYPQVVCRIFRKIEIRLSKANSYWLSKFSFSNLLTSRYFLLPH